MCFGNNKDAAVVGNTEACDNATNAFLRLKYEKRPSWLSRRVHLIKKMVRPVVEMLQKSHRTMDAGTLEKTSPLDYTHWDSETEEMDNNANEALESKLPECCCVPSFCYEVMEPRRFVHVPAFIPLAWPADADICLRDGGIIITSSQRAEQQSPCVAL